MGITKIAVKRPVTTVMCVLVVIAFGILSITNLQMDMLPNMNIPYALVYTTYDGAGPEEIENLITKPLESAVGTVQGVKNIMSISSNSSSMVMIEFEDSINLDTAALDVREIIDLYKNFLPTDANDPRVMKLDINSMSSNMSIGIYSDDTNLVELKSIVDDKIVNRLERLDGVASVSVSGGREKEILITLLEDKMRGFGITESAVQQVLAAENRNLPAGTVKQGDKSLQIRAEGEFDSLEDIRNLPLASVGNTIIYLRDIATVEEVFKEVSSYAYINGTPCVTVSISKQSIANTVNMSDAVLKELAGIEADYPNLHIKVIMDPADYIRLSISNVADSALKGGILAVIILYVFLRNFRSTLVVAAAMPVSIVATFVLMYYANITINLMSLGGLTLGVGMLVDNSIVVLESIYRKLENGENRITSAVEGTREVALSVIASTLTTIAVFLPISFVGGTVAQIFNELSMTIAFSLISSLVVAITFVPMCCSVILRPEQVEGRHKYNNIFTKLLDAFGNVFVSLERLYERVLNVVVRRKIFTIIVSFALVFVLLFLTMASPWRIGATFMASSDEGMVSVSISMPRGTILEETKATADEVISRIEQEEDIDYIFYSVGSSMSFLSGSTDSATIYVVLVPKAERTRSSEDVSLSISKRLGNIPGADIEVGAVQMSMGSYGGSDIEIRIYGDDTETLESMAKDFEAIIAGVPGTRDIASSIEEATPQATIKINRMKTSAYGISSSTIATLVNTAVSGSVATTYKIDGDELDIRIQQNQDRLDYITDIGNILIPSSTGISIPLYELADISVKDMPVSISRYNQSKYVSVTSLLDGRDLSSVSSDIDKALSSYIVPDGYYYEFEGTQQQMNEMFGSLALALIMSIFLLYMIMAAEFESLLYPFIVMFAIPIALTGGLFGLFVMRRELDVTGMLGLIMLAGIVINNAIVLIDYINLLRKERDMEMIEAIKIAGPVRLRPILMTTLTTSLALIPMMLGSGEGSEMMQGLAVVVVFGLTLSTLVTLLLIPAAYITFNRAKDRLSGFLSRLFRKQLRSGSSF